MKSITRFVTVLAASAVLIVPALAFAQTSIYSDSNGNFRYSSQNFVIGWGTGANSGLLSCGAGANVLCNVSITILNLINNVLVPLLFAIAFIVFLYGVASKYIFSHGDPEKVNEGHKLILWGLIAFAVMISIWGLVNVVANTFGLSGSYAPTPPRSTPL